jgi:hypothetical protein
MASGERRNGERVHALGASTASAEAQRVTKDYQAASKPMASKQLTSLRASKRASALAAYDTAMARYKDQAGAAAGREDLLAAIAAADSALDEMNAQAYRATFSTPLATALKTLVAVEPAYHLTLTLTWLARNLATEGVRATPEGRHVEQEQLERAVEQWMAQDAAPVIARASIRSMITLTVAGVVVVGVLVALAALRGGRVAATKSMQ